MRRRARESRPSTRPGIDEASVIAFRDAAAFDAWLGGHVDLRAGGWLKIAKKGSGVPSVTDDEAVDVGLCYGWISGQRKSFDQVYYLQKYVPRRPGSRWSRRNVTKVGERIAAGRMRPSGLAEVETAKADGRWAAAYDSQRHAEGRDPLRGHPALERLLQLCADRLDLGLEVPAFLGQEDPNSPSIVRVIPPHHQRGALHAIKMASERRTIEAKVVRELLHLHAVLLPQTDEDEQMVISDPEPPPAIIKFRDPSGRDVQEKANMLVQLHR